jgi:hypothetical protein
MEKCVTATEQAVETPGGGRDRLEDDGRFTPSQGGEPERRRDERRTRRQAGASENRAQGQRQANEVLPKRTRKRIGRTGISTSVRDSDSFNGSRQPPPDPATNI